MDSGEQLFSDEHNEFVKSERDSFVIEIEPWGDVEISAEPVTVHADMGGWHWQADGIDRHQASIRLWNRMRLLNPFDGLDWGRPGYLIGPLSTDFPADVQKRMMEYDEWLQKWEPL